jgi:hypothetical protein
MVVVTRSGAVEAQLPRLLLDQLQHQHQLLRRRLATQGHAMREMEASLAQAVAIFATLIAIAAAATQSLVA